MLPNYIHCITPPLWAVNWAFLLIKIMKLIKYNTVSASNESFIFCYFRKLEAFLETL